MGTAVFMFRGRLGLDTRGKSNDIRSCRSTSRGTTSENGNPIRDHFSM